MVKKWIISWIIKGLEESGYCVVRESSSPPETIAEGGLPDSYSSTVLKEWLYGE